MATVAGGAQLRTQRLELIERAGLARVERRLRRRRGAAVESANSFQTAGDAVVGTGVSGDGCVCGGKRCGNAVSSVLMRSA
jgi:hypothetical protein